MASLLDDLKDLFFVDDDDPRTVLKPDELERAIAANRILSKARAIQLVDPGWYADGYTPLFSDNGQVQLRLADMLGGATGYSSFPTFYLVESGRAVTVGEGVNGTEVAIDSEEYAFDELSMTVTFATARTETDPVVRLTGWMVDWQGVLYDLCTRYIHKLSLLPSVRGQEFTELTRRVTNMRDELYGSRVLRRSS